MRDSRNGNLINKINIFDSHRNSKKDNNNENDNNRYDNDNNNENDNKNNDNKNNKNNNNDKNHKNNYKNNLNIDITAAVLDDLERKLIIGTSSGVILIYNCTNGMILKSFPPMSTAIQFIIYSPDKTIIVIGSIGDISVIDDRNVLISDDYLLRYALFVSTCLIESTYMIESVKKSLYCCTPIKFFCFCHLSAFLSIVLALTHSIAHSFTHSLTRSLTHLLTYLLTYSLTHSPSHPLTPPLTRSLIHSLTHLLTYSLTHLLTHSLTHQPYHTHYTIHSALSTFSSYNVKPCPFTAPFRDNNHDGDIIAAVYAHSLGFLATADNDDTLIIWDYQVRSDLFVFAHVCIYVCVYVCVYLCMSVCMCICMYVYVRMYVYVYIFSSIYFSCTLRFQLNLTKQF